MTYDVSVSSETQPTAVAYELQSRPPFTSGGLFFVRTRTLHFRLPRAKQPNGGTVGVMSLVTDTNFFLEDVPKRVEPIQNPKTIKKKSNQ